MAPAGTSRVTTAPSASARVTRTCITRGSTWIVPAGGSRPPERELVDHVARLLSRCRTLVTAGGLVLCEVDPDPDRHEVRDVVLRSGDTESRPLRWARIGSRSLRPLAATQDLTVEEEWSGGGRCFVALRSRR